MKLVYDIGPNILKLGFETKNKIEYFKQGEYKKLDFKDNQLVGLKITEKFKNNVEYCPR